MAGQIWGQADQALGGWLPGGAASPISPVKKRVNDAVKTATKTVAGTVLNQFPDRVNLFGRYVTGVGNQNLQLDQSTLADLRDSTRLPEQYKQPIPEQFGGGFFYRDKQGPNLPQSGAINPYGNQPQSVTNTLGRFTAIANPRSNKVRLIDTYDMVNREEDPDLVSGKVQPVKAWNEVEAIWNPAAMYRNNKETLPDNFVFNAPNEGYSQESVNRGLKVTGESPTFSPATRLARAMMYLLPVKPNSFDIDVEVPYTGEIR